MMFSWQPDLISRDIERMLHYTLLWGFEAVDLRMIGNARVPHVNEEKLLRRLEEAEVAVASVNPGILEGPVDERVGWMNEIAALPETVRFCEHVGCRTILVSGFRATDLPSARDQAVDAFRRAADAAARHRLVLAVCNEPDGLFPTAESLAELIDAVGQDTLRASWSPVDEWMAGGTLDFSGLAPHIAHLRVSQVKGSPSRNAPAALDSGVIDWPKLLTNLRRADFDGIISMETRAEPVKKQAVRDATLLHQLWRRAGG